MPEKKYYSPSEVLDFLNEKFHPDPLLNLARLGRLRRLNRIHGERIGEKGSVYTRKALEMVTLADIQDKRRTHKNLPKVKMNGRETKEEE